MKYSEYVAELEDICRKKNFKLEEIGKTGKNNEYSIYAVKINYKPSGKNICFSAGIHGNEISGPLGVLEFMKEYDNYDKKLGIMILPICNPYGFEKNTRCNFKRLNLNKHFFDKKMPKENQILYNAVKKENIYFFASFHEDDVKKGLYIYAYSNNGKEPYKKIVESMSRYHKICKDEKIYKNKSKDGIIDSPKSDGSFEEKLYKDGIMYSSCIEIPDSIPLKERNEIAANIMKSIVEIISKELKNFKY